MRNHGGQTGCAAAITGIRAESKRDAQFASLRVLRRGAAFCAPRDLARFRKTTRRPWGVHARAPPGRSDEPSTRLAASERPSGQEVSEVYRQSRPGPGGPDRPRRSGKAWPRNRALRGWRRGGCVRAGRATSRAPAPKPAPARLSRPSRQGRGCARGSSWAAFSCKAASPHVYMGGLAIASHLHFLPSIPCRERRGDAHPPRTSEGSCCAFTSRCD